LLSQAGLIADFAFLSWRMWYELAGAVVMLTMLGAVVGHLLDEIAAHNERLEGRVRERTKELQALTEFTEAVLHRIPSAVVVTDGQGRIVWANQSAFRLLREWQRVFDGSASLLGQNGQTLLPDLSEVWAHLPKALNDGQVRSFPRLAIHTPSGRKTVRCALAPPRCRRSGSHLGRHHRRRAMAAAVGAIGETGGTGAIVGGHRPRTLQSPQRPQHRRLLPHPSLAARWRLSDDAQRYLAVIQRNVERTQRIITSVLAFARPSQRDDPSAVEAIKKGAADYLTKPLSPDQLLLSLERLFERLRLEEEENRQLREMLAR
jgi:signal transduction histidine kinase